MKADQLDPHHMQRRIVEIYNKHEAFDEVHRYKGDQHKILAMVYVNIITIKLVPVNDKASNYTHAHSSIKCVTVPPG